MHEQLLSFNIWTNKDISWDHCQPNSNFHRFNFVRVLLALGHLKNMFNTFVHIKLYLILTLWNIFFYFDYCLRQFTVIFQLTMEHEQIVISLLYGLLLPLLCINLMNFEHLGWVLFVVSKTLWSVELFFSCDWNTSIPECAFYVQTIEQVPSIHRWPWAKIQQPTQIRPKFIWQLRYFLTRADIYTYFVSNSLSDQHTHTHRTSNMLPLEYFIIRHQIRFIIIISFFFFDNLNFIGQEPSKFSRSCWKTYNILIFL